VWECIAEREHKAEAAIGDLHAAAAAASSAATEPSSMGDITRVVDEIRGLQCGIASAVEEQTATALEISRSISAMAQAAQETTVVVSTISELATTVERLADDVQLLLEH
jgi:methyl-accepting chemotaxis protein